MELRSSCLIPLSSGEYRANAQWRVTSAEVPEPQSSYLHFSTGVVLPYAEEGATQMKALWLLHTPMSNRAWCQHHSKLGNPEQE